jgi:hypothetical protein
MANSCPKCGAEIPAGGRVCVNCGASADAKPDIDNSAEIAKMLKGESPMNTENDSVVVGNELNDANIEAFESGTEIKFAGGDSLSELDGALSAMNEINFDEILGSEPEPAPQQTINFDNGGSVDPFSNHADDSHESHNEHDEHDDHDDHEGLIIQKGVTEVHGFKLPGFIKKIIACIFILAIGFGSGYGLHYFQSLGVFTNFTNDISLKSLRAVQEVAIPAGQYFKAVEIFVKRDADTTECIIFGVLFLESNNYTPTYFRLVYNNDDLTRFRILLPFNQERYDELLSSDDPLENQTAHQMMNYYNTFLLSVNEINAENPRWERADVEYVNKQLMLER